MFQKFTIGVTPLIFFLEPDVSY